MKKIEDKILQFFIDGGTADGKNLDRKIRNDPSFGQADFDLFEKIWRASDQLSEYREADLDDAWDKITAGTNQVRTPRRISWWLARAAAAVLLLLNGFALYHWLNWDDYITYRTDVASTLVLPDGTKADLEGGTVLRYLREEQFVKDDQREVFLEGEGTFDVVSDTAKPFSVVSKLTSIDVLGTVFSYMARGDSSQAENIEGQVRFRSNTGAFEPAVMNPGDRVTFDGDSMVHIEFVPEPVPPPVIREEPKNFLRVIDLIDILSEKYQNTFIPGPGSDRNGRVVVEVNLDQDLAGIIGDLEKQSHIDISYRRSGRTFTVSDISAQSTGLRPDYTYQMYANGISYKRGE